MKTEKSELIRHLMEKGDSRSDKTIILGTHNNEFHADDVLATVVLMHELCPLGYKVRVIRSRNVKFLNESCDLVYDVGHGKYDHHDDCKAFYPNGIPMAACGKILNDVITDPEILEALRIRLFYAVEANDNGHEVSCSMESSKLAFISSFNPTWNEPRTSSDFYKAFMRAIPVVGNIYERILSMVQSDIAAREYISKDDHAVFFLDGSFCEIDKYCPTFEYARRHPEFLGAMYRNETQWIVRLAPSFKKRHATRCSFPREWCGKYSPNHESPLEDLSSISGLESARFCHPSGFLMSFDNRDDAMEACRIVYERNKQDGY